MCLLACTVAACGGSGGVDDPPAAAPPNVTASGGTVVSNDGRVTLTIPAGAASVPATVTLSAETGAAPSADAFIVDGTRYRIGGEGGALAADATITFTADRAFPTGFLRGPADNHARALAWR